MQQSQVVQISSFLPHFVWEEDLRQQQGWKVVRRLESRPFSRASTSTRAFQRFPVVLAHGSRVFHKYLQKRLKDCSLQLSIHCTNLCIAPFLLTPQNQRAEDLGAFDLEVNALILMPLF